MSLKRNIFASYASQLYVTLIGIAMLPFYVKYMGVEVYGLVGFFAMVQGWFLLLDMGLTPTMAREAARFRGGVGEAVNLRRLLRSLEGVFLCIALLGAACLIVGAELIAGRWLKAEYLPRDEVANAVKLMALIMALRWFGELYRGVITGFERLAWLGSFNAAMTTARFVGVIPFFIFVGSSALEFFFFQLCVAAVELLALTRKAYALLPAVPPAAVRWSWRPLRSIMSFSLTMAIASVVWISASQTDKLLLSGLLSLVDYGWFSLTALAASGVLLLTGPIATALLPRLTALNAQGDGPALLSMYRRATQWIGLLAWPVCGVLAFQAERVLWVWTGDVNLAAQAATTMCLYTIGNGAMALSALPYYLQFAKGELRLHLLGTGLFVLMLLPCLIWTTNEYGAVGAGWTWLSVNLIYFVLWIPVVHARYAPGLHLRWLFHDVVPIAMLALTTALASRWLPWPEQRFLVGVQLLMILLGGGVIGAMGSSWCRSKLAHYRVKALLEWQR
ncbi:MULTISPECIES: lipopolysaccharide biosynthesis protein [unclassified Polaromonas]|uniref:lipopolysaccharide biosynthesis protein n=1 Tax=unclassified Polaromonas TaxID=2638319 RepID=UPI000F093F7D|nr:MULTISPECIES: oligosaccharide flippase family protein [unclassified Polaromonas]AYQ27911.1 polysaccharide biosynthesis protein [Polaromonas sp. SP1]QGJ17228.1 oligosaccharide flippase family protein [Polaromonas sp. Pch-P]